MTKTIVLNHSAMALKLRSIFTANKEIEEWRVSIGNCHRQPFRYHQLCQAKRC